jgi:hypothetical protein
MQESEFHARPKNRLLDRQLGLVITQSAPQSDESLTRIRNGARSLSGYFYKVPPAANSGKLSKFPYD